MLIGTKSDYLKIDKRDQNDPYSAFTIEAGIENSRASFCGGHFTFPVPCSFTIIYTLAYTSVMA